MLILSQRFIERMQFKAFRCSRIFSAAVYHVEVRLTIDGDVASSTRDANQSDWVQARLCRQRQGSGEWLKLHSRGQQALNTTQEHERRSAFKRQKNDFEWLCWPSNLKHIIYTSSGKELFKHLYITGDKHSTHHKHTWTVCFSKMFQIEKNCKKKIIIIIRLSQPSIALMWF